MSFSSASTGELTAVTTMSPDSPPIYKKQENVGRLPPGTQAPLDSELHQLTVMDRTLKQVSKKGANLPMLDLGLANGFASNGCKTTSTTSSVLTASTRSQSAPPTARALLSDFGMGDESDGLSDDERDVAVLESPAMYATRIPSAAEQNRKFFDAQNRYPGKACIFVGNLPAADFNDLEMTMLVETEFSAFGKCFVRVQRVTKGNGIQMPHAYVQYTNHIQAKIALKHGGKINVNGRQFRTEPSRAKRTIMIGHRNGTYTMLGEACAALARFGEIERAVCVNFSDGTFMHSFVKVTFVTYGSYTRARNVITTLYDPIYLYLA